MVDSIIKIEIDCLPKDFEKINKNPANDENYPIIKQAIEHSPLETTHHGNKGSFSFIIQSTLFTKIIIFIVYCIQKKLRNQHI